MDYAGKIKDIVEAEMQTTVQSVSAIGSGATATAYQVEISAPPQKVVVKVGKYIDLLVKEKKSLDFLASRVHYKVPKTYFVTQDGDLAFLALEHIEGLSGANRKILFLRDKKYLADNVIDCLLDMQSVHNDKFGAFENPQYDTWQAYYMDFFQDIFQFLQRKNTKKGAFRALLWMLCTLLTVILTKYLKRCTVLPVYRMGIFGLPIC